MGARDCGDQVRVICCHSPPKCCQHKACCMLLLRLWPYMVSMASSEKALQIPLLAHGVSPSCTAPTVTDSVQAIDCVCTWDVDCG